VEAASTRFNIARYLDEQDYKPSEITSKSIKNESFRDLIDHFDQDMQEQFKAMTDEEKLDQLQFQHEAIIGVPQSVQYMKDRIKDYVLKRGLSKTDFPSYYSDLTDAIFHERYGLGPLSTWYRYPKSEAAQVIGTNIYYSLAEGKKLQKEQFDSLDRVYDICNALTMKNATARLNESNPHLEIDMYDGTRVTIDIPPRTQVPVITFRRFVVSEFTLEYQSSRSTIPAEAIPVLRAIARTRANIIISGPVRSAKSSFLKTLYAERNEEDTAIVIEKIFELYLRRDFPKRPIIEYQASNEKELDEIFAGTLRHDGTYWIIGEIRSIEADLYLRGCERGSSGCLGTHHSTYAENVPGLIARHVVDAYPGRNYRQELIRAAQEIDYVITMEELRDGVRKLTSINEVCLDPYTHEVSTVTIMEFNADSDDWFYHDHVSDKLFKKMKKYSLKHATIFQNTLGDLAKSKPITGQVKKISLESKVEAHA
jgi:pilus assembly protein CpaF